MGTLDRHQAVATLAAAALACCAAPALAGVPAHLRHHDVVQPRIERSAVARTSTRIALEAFGRSMVLELEPSTILSPSATTSWVSDSGTRTEPSAAAFYRGGLEGDPGSTVRLAVDDGALLGSVVAGDETWFFEPLRRHEPSAAAAATLVYRPGDIDASAMPEGACAAGEDTGVHVTSAGASTAASRAARVHGPGLGLLEVTLVADHHWFAAHGAQSAVDMQAIVDQVDAFYREDLGVTLQVVGTVVYETPEADPFSTSTVPLTLLESVAMQRSSSPSTVGAGGLTHLFTGRDLDQNVIGIAYLQVVCDPGWGVGLSQDFASSLHMMTLLAGHEIGHNLGASHDGQSGSPCQSSPYGFVMWPSLDSSLAESFSTCSVASIDPVVDAAACIGAAIPEDCGDGVLDPGEDCDDGANEPGDCCRIDCVFDYAGARCGDDANACTDDLCDAGGACNHWPNDDACDDADACTLDGTCEAGACVPSTARRALSRPKWKASFGPGDGDDALVAKASLDAGALESLPTEAGARVRLLDRGGTVLVEAFVEASSWTGTATAQRYRADVAPLPAASGLVSMQVKHRASTGTAKVKLKFAGAELGDLEGLAAAGLEILLGSDEAGDCGAGTALACTTSSTKLACAAP